MSAADGAPALAAALGRSGHRWGVAARDLPAFEGAAGAAAVAAGLDQVRELGGEALLLASPREASPTLDDGELREVGALAVERGVALHLSLGLVHPQRLDLDEVRLRLAAAGHLGVAVHHVIFGLMEDRFATSPTWTEQLGAAVDPLRGLLADVAAPVVMRTHEEMTTVELNRLLDDVGSEQLTVGYSPVNVVCRVEDPWLAYERVADRVSCLFLDDCRVARTSTGAARRLSELGTGAVPWLEIVDATTASGRDVVAILDLARAEFDMPWYDREWLRHQPDLTPAELAALLARTEATAVPSPLAARGAAAIRVLALASEARAAARATAAG